MIENKAAHVSVEAARTHGRTVTTHSHAEHQDDYHLAVTPRLSVK